ncbi:transcriptional regulator, TetR family [Nannocystis exedens]|uniref:Transcriptional regulator, TetR family n=1 Tax=Nannocystis exedens TaxID=54 RepID=A0A1I1UX19_9BACT|nr:TetR/AcrR family transcriptional regulator [Nannocystis exedens]PCC72146.1 AcrR family transcriptional regulator [Nannocystis exedens]SFD75105.1 transcriptional regulator, TetR family [Nannocystis exedens]
MHDKTEQPDEAGAMKRGRKRDASLDARLLDATLDVLAEVGAAGLTMDLVAARAGVGKATIYRRWTAKSELIIDAVAQMKRNQVDLEHLPDTGTLRGDLLGLFKPQSNEERERRLKIMTALASLLSQDPALAGAANGAVVEPWAAAHRALMERAVARGEISAAADIATLSQVIPSMAAYRSLVQRKSFDFTFLVSMVDGVILPALGIEPSPDHESSSPRRAARRTRPRTEPARRKS